MALYLLDSDAVIDYFSGAASAVALLQQLYEQENILCLCNVVIAEIYSGFTAEERAEALDFVTSCRFLETTVEMAMLAGEWRYRFARQGITLAITDTMIAATAYAHQATIVTRNLRDYPMPEVTVLPLPRATRR